MALSASVNSPRRRPSYWSQLSDAELLNYDFYQNDPTKLEGLHQTVPDTDEVPEVEFTYNTLLTDGRLVRCVHCRKQAPNHNRGFVLKFFDGTRMLVGKDCGQKLYGAEFAHSRRDFETALSRQELLVKLGRIYRNKRELVDLLEQIEAHPAWEAYVDHRAAFNKMFSEMVPQLVEAATNLDGALIVDSRVPDAEAESEYLERTGRVAKFFKSARVEIHRLRGKPFFTQVPSIKRSVQDHCKQATRVLWNLEVAEGVSNRDLGISLRFFAKLIQTLTEYAQHVASLEQALSPENIDGISRWLTAGGGHGSLRLKGGLIQHLNKRGEVRRIYVDAYYSRMGNAEMEVPRDFATPLDLIARASALLSA